MRASMTLELVSRQPMAVKYACCSSTLMKLRLLQVSLYRPQACLYKVVVLTATAEATCREETVAAGMARSAWKRIFGNASL